MMTTCFKKIMALVVCLFAGLTTQAQFQGTVTQYPTSDYSNSPVKFSLSEVAQALDADAATLAQTYNTWQDAETWEGENLFWLIGANDVATDEPTADGKGFWMTAEGERIVYGEGAVWFAFALVDVENDVFSINCGQMPNVMKADDSGHAKFQLRLNGKSVNFEVTLNVVAKPVVDIPEAELAWGKLTLVDEIIKDVEQKPRSGYDADKVEVDLTAAIAKLGVAPELVQDELRKLLFAKMAYVTEDAAIGAQMSDLLTNESSAGGIGFWLRNVSDAEGNPLFECGRFSYDGDDSFFAEAFEYNAETGILSCNLGQMPNKLKGGNTYFADLYIVYGDKAVKIRYNLVLEEVKLGTLEDYEKAGESTMKVEMEPKTSGDYSTKDFSIDIETITTALGCAVGEIDDFYMLDSDVDFAGKNQEGVGYWVAIDGSVIGWGDNAMFYVTPKADDLSRFGIGQYPDHMSVGDSARANLYFLANGKYYQLGIDLVIVEPTSVDVVFQSVAQRSVEVQQVPGEYIWTEGVEIPQAWVEEQIGTSDWTLYALDVLNEDGSEKEGNARYTKSYTCSPYPGFWMDAEGRNVGWNKTPTRVGITVASPEGKFSLMQHPGVALGDVFHFPIFLVNEENGKMVTFNFTYSVVESVTEVEEVGTEDIVLPVSEEGAVMTIDLAKAAEALGTTVDALMEGKFLHGVTADGTYSAGVSAYDGLSFTDKGVVTSVEADVFMYFGVEANEDGKTGTLTTYAVSAVADDFSAMGLMCFLVNDKRYVYNVKFQSEKAITDGINASTRQLVNSSTIYDLQGRKIQKASRGLYIQNGRKYIVK